MFNSCVLRSMFNTVAQNTNFVTVAPWKFSIEILVEYLEKELSYIHPYPLKNRSILCLPISKSWITINPNDFLPKISMYLISSSDVFYVQNLKTMLYDLKPICTVPSLSLRENVNHINLCTQNFIRKNSVATAINKKNSIKLLSTHSIIRCVYTDTSRRIQLKF